MTGEMSGISARNLGLWNYSTTLEESQKRASQIYQTDETNNSSQNNHNHPQPEKKSFFSFSFNPFSYFFKPKPSVDLPTLSANQSRASYAPTENGKSKKQKKTKESVDLPNFEDDLDDSSGQEMRKISIHHISPNTVSSKSNDNNFQEPSDDTVLKEVRIEPSSYPVHVQNNQPQTVNLPNLEDDDELATKEVRKIDVKHLPSQQAQKPIEPTEPKWRRTAKKVVKVMETWTKPSTLYPFLLGAGLIALAGLMYMYLDKAEEKTEDGIKLVDTTVRASIDTFNYITQTVPDSVRNSLFVAQGNLTDTVNDCSEFGANTINNIANWGVQTVEDTVNSCVYGINAYLDVIKNTWEDIEDIAEDVADYCSSFGCPDWPNLNIPDGNIDELHLDSVDLSAPLANLTFGIPGLNLSSIKMDYPRRLWNMSEPGVKSFYKATRQVPYYIWLGGSVILTAVFIKGTLETLGVLDYQPKSKVVQVTIRCAKAIGHTLKKLLTSPGIMIPLIVGILFLVAAWYLEQTLTEEQDNMHASVKDIDAETAKLVRAFNEFWTNIITIVNRFINEQLSNLDGKEDEIWDTIISNLETQINQAIKPIIDAINEVLEQLRENYIPAPNIGTISIKLPSGSLITIPKVPGLPTDFISLDEDTLSIEKNLLPVVDALIERVKELSGGMKVVGTFGVAIPSIQLTLNFLIRCLS